MSSTEYQFGDCPLKQHGYSGCIPSCTWFVGGHERCALVLLANNSVKLADLKKKEENNENCK